MCDLKDLKYKLIVAGAFFALCVAVAGVMWEINKKRSDPLKDVDLKKSAVLSDELNSEKAKEAQQGVEAQEKDAPESDEVAELEDLNEEDAEEEDEDSQNNDDEADDE